MTPSILSEAPRIRVERSERAPMSCALALLRERCRAVEEIPGADAPGMLPAATATLLMDEYRRSGSAEVFECLIQVAADHLEARVRRRLRFLGANVDPNEVLQDVIINIYRYPDRFDASRPGAFAAWSSTIVDNTIRRQMRRARSVESLSPAEVLAQHPGAQRLEPDRLAQDQEECAQTLTAFRLLLRFYLAAFHQLSERERFVLQMVEVRQMRYAELAAILGIRPEALKMVVFRARRRVSERIAQWFAQGAPGAPRAA